MSVTTVGEQRRRAGAAPRRSGMAAAPGQRATAPGGARERRPEDRRPPGARGRGAPILTLVTPQWSDTVEGQEGAAPWQGPAASPRPPRGTEERPPHGTGEVPRRVTRDTPAGPARGRVRLTRRGRIVVAVLMIAAMVLVAALAWLAGTARADAARGGTSPAAVYHSLRSVIVRPGQSLWEIAAQAAPGADPRSVIQEIIDINALGGMSVQPGQRLWLPRG